MLKKHHDMHMLCCGLPSSHTWAAHAVGWLGSPEQMHGGMGRPVQLDADQARVHTPPLRALPGDQHDMLGEMGKPLA